jgi:quinoprotein glucose dehydrogenase
METVQDLRSNSRAHTSTFRVVSVILLGCCAIWCARSEEVGHEHTRWREYGGAADSAQYSGLRQIDRTNVKNLKIAWIYRTGDNKKYYFNPIMVDGLLYVLAENNSVVALDAATGKQIWAHATDPDTTLMTTRGINYWESEDKSDRRLFYASNNILRALDARTGKLIDSFGINGGVDLRENLGRDPKTVTVVQALAPGRVFDNLLILGSATGQAWGSAPGDVRAYDVRSGRLMWSFHTIPHPGEFGYDTWPKDAWKTTGGANAWGELSLDEKRGIVYVPTASPKYNFYGGERIGADLFADCLLALDARTGKRVWHFQMVHHDIWDYDDNTAPKLLTVEHDGRPVDIVAETSKQGFVYVFNRVTGEPIWPIEERPVPQTDVPGEKTWATQPFPAKPPPFARQKFTADDLSPFITDPAERARYRDKILSARNAGLDTPPGRVNTIQMPGNVGGANWGSAAVDPANGSMYVVSKDFPTMLKMERDVVRQAPLTGTPEQQGHILYGENCQPCHGVDRKGQPPAIPSLVDITQRQKPEEIENTVKRGIGPMPGFSQLSERDLHSLLAYLSNPAAGAGAVAQRPDAGTSASSGPVRYHSGFGYMTTSDGLSAIRPPWSTLTAYDMNLGIIKWQIPLGDYPPLAAKGITGTGSHFPRVGPVVTGGGLIFTGTRDRKVRAFDEETGKVLWETTLDSALEGMPAVYELGGREYIVFCAAARDGTVTFEKPGQFSKVEESGGAYVAFTLGQ